jgi:Fe-S cluster biogenesis protein NfuA
MLQKEDLPKGAILHLKGINSEITRDNIKNQLLTDGLDVAFVGFNEGDDEAWVRLLGENSSKDVCD